MNWFHFVVFRIAFEFYLSRSTWHVFEQSHVLLIEFVNAAALLCIFYEFPELFVILWTSLWLEKKLWTQVSHEILNIESISICFSFSECSHHLDWLESIWFAHCEVQPPIGFYIVLSNNWARREHYRCNVDLNCSCTVCLRPSIVRPPAVESRSETWSYSPNCIVDSLLPASGHLSRPGSGMGRMGI